MCMLKTWAVAQHQNCACQLMTVDFIVPDYCGLDWQRTKWNTQQFKLTEPWYVNYSISSPGLCSFRLLWSLPHMLKFFPCVKLLHPLNKWGITFMCNTCISLLKLLSLRAKHSVTGEVHECIQMQCFPLYGKQQLWGGFRLGLQKRERLIIPSCPGWHPFQKIWA